jgi:hypothetical protein
VAETNELYEFRNLVPESVEVISAALQKDAVARRIFAKNECPQPGEHVGIRLNLNVLRATQVLVHTVHRATSKDGHTRGNGVYRGEVISYLPVVVLKDCYFNVHQGGREGIAAGRMSKHPMASCDGTFTEQPKNPSFDGVEVSFNPHRTHLFIDRNAAAVQYAEHVTILGHRAFARGNIIYFTEANAPKRAGDAPSIAKFTS